MQHIVMEHLFCYGRSLGDAETYCMTRIDVDDLFEYESYAEPFGLDPEEQDMPPILNVDQVPWVLDTRRNSEYDPEEWEGDFW